MRTISTIITLAVLLSPAFVKGQDISLEYSFADTAYRAGETVIVGIRADIPSGYHLYGNPLGPGIGRPLNLFVNRVGPQDNGIDVVWTEAWKSAPKKYKPRMGDWVWAYQSEAYFFLRGVLTNGNIDNSGDNRKVQYEAIIEALICRTSCIPIEKRITFELPVSPDIIDKPVSAFSGTPKWQTLYAKSEPMTFKTGAPASGFARTGNDNQPQLGINIDLLGLSSAVGSLTELSSAESSSSEKIQADSKDEIAFAVDGEGNILWDYTPVEAKREYNLLTAVLFAFLAGLALNLTPCIFPLLGVRILSFAESARESRRRAVVRSVCFAGGILAVFLLLAACAAFAGFSWGQQFQNPTIMMVIIAVIVLFALGMFDFYTMAAPSVIGNAERRAGATLFGDFLKGAAATVMATPCGGPFLGALLAWALLQNPLTIFLLFAVMGVGMALPYILLSSIRKLQQMLPKPGRWIEDFKHVMGFVLLLFAVNLLKSLDSGLTVTAVGICLSILCAASVNKRFAPFGVSGKRRLVVVMLALIMLAAGTAVSVVYLRGDVPIVLSNNGQTRIVDPIIIKRDSGANPVDTAGNERINTIGNVGYNGINSIDIVGYGSTNWNDFSPAALIKAREEGRSVIVNFTASWCTNCKLNKAAALDIPAAHRIYADKNIALLTADITNRNPHAQSLLRHLGSRSVPFLAIFPADSHQKPIIMRDILRKDKYLSTLRNLP